MADEQKQEKQTVDIKEVLAKVFFIFARFSWLFGIIIGAIMLLAFYRFIIQPQYQKILDRQEEVRQLNLEGERAKLQTHLENLKNFITLSGAITVEEKNGLDKLLRVTPDPLVLRIQFEKLLSQYDAKNADITFSDPVFEDITADEAAPAATTQSRRGRVVDLSEFFEAPVAEVPAETNDESDAIPQVLLGSMPVSISVTFDDYFKAKDFLADLERLVPLVDIDSITLSIAQAAQTGVSNGVSAPISNVSTTGGASLTLTGVVHIVTLQ